MARDGSRAAHRRALGGGRDRRADRRGGDRSTRSRVTYAWPSGLGDGWGVNEWVKKAILLYFRLRKVEPMDVGGLHFLDKIPVKADYAASRRTGRPSGRGAVRLVPRRRCRPHAGFRQHRCLGGAADDGRYVGDRRVVRADRRGCPPLRRRRDRRRARAAPGASGDRRGRRVPRLARGCRRRGHRRRGSGDRPQRRPLRVRSRSST